MDTELKRQLLSSYMSKEEAEKISEMMDKSKKSVLENTLIGLNIENKPEYLRGSVVLFDGTSGSGEFVIGKYSITNVTNESQTAIIEIILNKSKVITREYVIASKETKGGLIRLSDKESEGLDETSVNCRVEIADSIKRIVFKTLSTIIMTSEKTSPKISADIKFDEYDNNKKMFGVKISIKSDDDLDRDCVIAITTDSQLLLKKRYIVASRTSLNDYVNMTTDSSFNALKATITCEGAELASIVKRIVDNNLKSPLTLLSTKQIFADCRFDTIVDINNQKDGMVAIGVLGIRNSSSAPEHISCSISLDGEVIDSESTIVASKSTIEKSIAIPVKMLSKDDTYATTIRCSLFDSDSKAILERISQIMIRSRFDMNLHKLQELTAKYVNPLDSEVKRFVDSKSGPLAKAMGDAYTVSGYMVPNAILPQLESVYVAIQSYDVAYVSDTSTLVKDGHFQRVRDPPTVLRDHSGNCIELSILMASIYECMGFEPVVVFPRGHAIVGVVVGTNVYRSKSVRPVGIDGAIIRMGGKENYLDVLFIESTAVANKNVTFADAVMIANKEVMDEIGYIMSNKMYSVIAGMRGRM